MPSEIYIALRLSGGDLLKWCRVVGGRPLSDLQDVPLPLLTEWYSKGDMLRQMDQLERGKFYGFLDPDKVDLQLNEMRVEAGFLAPIDREFGEYFKNYKQRKARHTGEADIVIQIKGFGPWSIRQAQVLELRNQCIASLRRRRGVGDARR